jgi:hypothetical protein
VEIPGNCYFIYDWIESKEEKYVKHYLIKNLQGFFSSPTSSPTSYTHSK